MASTGRVFITDLNDDSEYQKLLDGPPQTFGMRSGRVYLDPGQSCGQHSTDSNEEILIFLSGRGLLLIGESVSFRIGQGKIAYIPPNTVHDIKNTGDDTLIYIYCAAPVIYI